MLRGFVRLGPLLALGLLAGVSPASWAATCSAALVERLATPRVASTADSHEVSMRRSVGSTERADALLLKDALRRALAKDPSLVMQLRGVTYAPIVSCEGFRIVSLSVRKENVSFVAAPPAPPAPPVVAAPLTAAAPAAVAAPAVAPAVVPAAAGGPAPVPAPASGEESTERLVDLWQSRQATTAQLRLLQSRMTLGGERTLAGQLGDDIAASMRQRELTPRDLTPRELTPRELTPRELPPVQLSLPQ